MNIQAMGQGWKLGVEAGEKKKDQEGIGASFADVFASLSEKKLQGAQAASSKGTAGNANVKEFTDYMKKSLAERMEDAWLKRHNMTREQFEALPANEKLKIIAQMKEELELKMKQQVEANLKKQGAFVVG